MVFVQFEINGKMRQSSSLKIVYSCSLIFYSPTMATGCSEEFMGETNIDRIIKKKQHEINVQRKKKLYKEKQNYLVQLIANNSALDVAFLMDWTGSMYSYINETKEKIECVVNFIKKEYGNQVKVAFVGYRDHTDGDMRIECIQFTENISGFKDSLKNIQATGGKDIPEDVLGGLEMVGNLKWSSKIKVLIHIADAPQHGPRFHDLGKEADTYFDEEPRGLKAEDVIHKIKEKNIKYFFVKINETMDKMIKVFNDIAGKKFIEEVDLKSPDLLSKFILRSLTETLNASISNEVMMDDFSGSFAIGGTKFFSTSFICLVHFQAVFVFLV